jgi:hypothetical protein
MFTMFAEDLEDVSSLASTSATGLLHGTQGTTERGSSGQEQEYLQQRLLLGKQYAEGTDPKHIAAVTEGVAEFSGPVQCWNDSGYY